MRWLGNWRNWAAPIVAAIVAIVAFLVWDGQEARQEANDGLRRANRVLEAELAERERLHDRVDVLVGEVAASVFRIGELVAQVAALQDQIEASGRTPVVPRTTTTTRPPTTTTTTRPATTTTTTTTTTAPACDGVEVFGRCVGPNQRRNQ